MLPWRSTPTPADEPHSRPSGNCGFQLSSHLYGLGAEAACARSATEATPTTDTSARDLTTFVRKGQLSMAILRLHPPRFTLGNQVISPSHRRRWGPRPPRLFGFACSCVIRMFVNPN